ncbi:MAG: TIGR03663 family protein [Rubrivivax sp.]|nr:TIGR03663 family protein [Pyrinomonadaceae bacterium]
MSAGASKREASATEKRRTQDVTLPPDAASEISERAWLIASVIILMAATALRVYALELKPMHHDEGVNGFFLTSLLRQGKYFYDPNNYHGPTLYYLTLPVAALFGLTTFAVRFVTVLFGVGIVWLVLSLRRRIGTVGALVAAALVAVSPGCVYYSRYFIHEIPFVFFTLAIVVAALRFYETGAAYYLLLASASAAMLFATKETAFISVGTLALAWLVALAWVKWQEGERGKRRGGDGVVAESGLAKFGASAEAQTVVVGAVALFVAIWVLFYSSLFTNWKGVADSFKAFVVWKQTGMSEFHGKPLYNYVLWLWQEEAPILILAAVGSCVALFERKRNRFAIFAGAWGFGLLAAYSLISYKTPWLMLSFVVPMCIAAGYAVQALGRLGPVGAKGLAPALVLAGIALAVCTYQTYVLNFREYDNDAYIYVYSHTRRQLHDMLKEVERAGAVAGQKEPGITVAADEYWPLPWYFRDNTHAGYVGKSVAASYDPQTTLMVIGRKSDDPEHDTYKKLRPILAANYVEAGFYSLRPGVDLVLFERRDLAGK